ncbi:Variant-specific surface protein [Giardia duodenalis]|uniref:Variant-specific surface protein n=1 Tax=Giardia intestinalis TaxID=5741 RepID=V6TF16_GIAIN|nr:Variant-specific surface protein [Giardia intestinalis]
MLKVSLMLAVGLAALCGDTGYECGDHGTCTLIGKVYRCVCAPGWTGYDCSSCSRGFVNLVENCIPPSCIEDGLECGGRGTCLYLKSKNAWECGSCPVGFYQYSGRCVSSYCYGDEEAGGVTTERPCSGQGICIFNGASEADRVRPDVYICSCNLIHTGSQCQNCDPRFGKIDPLLRACVAMSCYDGEDTEPCQGRGECVENIQQHPFTGELTTGYICRCGYPYQLVGTAKCLPLNCVSTQAGVATECGTGGVCESSGSQFSCRCLSGFVQLTDGHCTAPACRQNDGALACSDIGACVSGGEDPTDPSTYYCQCPMSYSSGDYCEVCDNQRGTTINGKCVAKSCVVDNTVCSNNGDCVLEGLFAYRCKCHEGYEAHGTNVCAKPGCWDSIVNKTCSGAGQCTSNGCQCNSGFTLRSMRCIPTKLINGSWVCSGNGTATISSSSADASKPENWICQCDGVTKGTLCNECNTERRPPAAYMINNVCTAAACVSDSTTSPPTICNGVQGATCSQYGVDADSVFYCKTPDKSQYLVAYNSSLVVHRGCTYPSKTEYPLNLYCGLLDGHTMYIDDPGAPQCLSTLTYTCSCEDPFNFVTVEDTIKSELGDVQYRTSCIHKACLNPDLKGTTDETVLQNPDSYCNGLGDCLQDDHGDYTCFCGPGSTYFKGTCVSNACLTQDPETDATLVCGGLGVCDVDAYGHWGCFCGYPYFGSGSSCYPVGCGFYDPLSGVTLLCGGEDRGTCVANEAHPELATCACNRGFTLIGSSYCAPSACTAYGADREGVEPSLSYVCSGIGECFRDPLTGDYRCHCGEGYYATGPYCTLAQCVVVIDAGEAIPGLIGNLYLECGFAGAGTCTSDGCTCNSGYVKTASLSMCVRAGCIDENNIYCGGDHHAACVDKGDGTGFSCVCTAQHVNVNGTCVPKKCVTRDVNGNNVVCGGRGRCIQMWTGYMCACDNNTPAVPSGDSYTCPHPDCCGQVGEDMVVCSDQGSCKETATGGFCVCNNGYSLVGKSQCIVSECVQTDGNGVTSICGGGECIATNDVHSCACANGFSNVDGRCVHSNCIDTYDGEQIECSGFGKCTAVDSSYKCVCNLGYSPGTEPNRCFSVMCLSTIGDKGYECGGHGKCMYSEEQEEFSCTCESGYKNIDDTSAGYSITYFCVTSGCTTTSEAGQTVCNGGGMCDPTSGRCVCNEGHAGDTCADCADGYIRPPEEYIFKHCMKTTCADSTCGGTGMCVPSLLYNQMVCECADHHTPLDGRCVPCAIDNCETCDVSQLGRACSLCQDGTYLSGDQTQCLPCHADCKTCQGPQSTQCLSCIEGKVHSLNGMGASGCKEECRINMDGCKSCGAMISKTKYCSQCQSQTSVPVNGECKSQATRASECSRYSKGACLACADGYFLYEGGCYETSKLPGRDVCSMASSGSCSYCKIGYSNLAGTCTACKNENCASCNIVTTCDECKPGWSLVNGECVSCAAECESCTQGSPSTCKSCKDEYFASFSFSGDASGPCRPCSDTTPMDGIVGVPGCKYCTLPLTNGTNENPVSVICLTTESTGKMMSTGAIAGITIAVLVVVGGSVAGVLVWFFLFRNRKGPMKKSPRRRFHPDETSTSLLSQDYGSSML